MRGLDLQWHELFYCGSVEQRIPADHPLRAIRATVDHALEPPDGHFDERYDYDGRPSMALVRQLGAAAADAARLDPERAAARWSSWSTTCSTGGRVGLGMSEEVWHATRFTRNRDRLLEGEVARVFFGAVVRYANRWRLMSSGPFSMDGTMVEAWADHKSVKPKTEVRDGDRREGRGHYAEADGGASGGAMRRRSRRGILRRGRNERVPTAR